MRETPKKRANYFIKMLGLQGAIRQASDQIANSDTTYDRRYYGLVLDELIKIELNELKAENERLKSEYWVNHAMELEADNERLKEQLSKSEADKIAYGKQRYDEGFANGKIN